VKFDHEIVVEAGAKTVEAFLDDIPAVARCMPGIEEVVEVAPGAYEGRLRLRLGPLGFSIAGRAELERSEDGAWRLRGEGRDRRLGAGVEVQLDAQLAEEPGGRTRIAFTADVQLSGRLAELGQPLIRRKADSMVREFAENLGRAIAQGSA
jgi:carbon monoxide dehydrogenase subunit G